MQCIQLWAPIGSYVCVCVCVCEYTRNGTNVIFHIDLMPRRKIFAYTNLFYLMQFPTYTRIYLQLDCINNNNITNLCVYIDCFLLYTYNIIVWVHRRYIIQVMLYSLTEQFILHGTDKQVYTLFIGVNMKFFIVRLYLYSVVAVIYSRVSCFVNIITVVSGLLSYIFPLYIYTLILCRTSRRCRIYYFNILVLSVFRPTIGRMTCS